MVTSGDRSEGLDGVHGWGESPSHPQWSLSHQPQALEPRFKCKLPCVSVIENWESGEGKGLSKTEISFSSIFSLFLSVEGLEIKIPASDITLMYRYFHSVCTMQ